MKILVLNGSPRGTRSNTAHLTKAFLAGIEEVTAAETEILPVCQLKLNPCIGCFNCWSKTPGKCCIEDDMGMVIEKMIAADIMIWSFPLYYFGVPSPLKMLMDRQLPMCLPYMEKRTDGNSDTGSHPSRYDRGAQRTVIISTCGFYTAEGNYDSLNLQFDRCLGKNNYETIYCGQGELFNVPEVKKRADEYLAYVKQAGREFMTKQISFATKRNLAELLYPREAFEQMANASWEIADDGHKPLPDPEDTSLRFTKQMAALYNPAAWRKKDIVLEIYYTDVEKKYQIVLGKTGQKVLKDEFLPYTTKIETSFDLWQRIARGESDGQRALSEGLYRVSGDLHLLINWDNFFGSAAKHEIDTETKKSNMSLVILPWFPIWMGIAIDPYVSGLISIFVAACLPFAFLRWKPTVFECVSSICIAGFGLLGVLGYPAAFIVPASYVIVGLLWTATIFLKTPLTAYYSMNNYGGEKALQNQLFVRTNRILTGVWGVFYLLTSIWTYFLLLSSFAMLVGVFNSILPMFIGLFTVWFQQWYPAYCLRRINSAIAV